MTTQRINKAIIHTGLELRKQDESTWYFFDKVKGHQVGETLILGSLNQYSLGGWLTHAEWVRSKNPM